MGGISILTDRALLVGDACKIGDQRGLVEDIGLRSTKLRTEERTLVSIPNGTVATATLENFRLRDKILFRQIVRLRYDLSPDHVRYVLEQLLGVLTRHAKVEAASARVRLLKLGENAIEVEIYSYILTREYREFLAVQEDLILQAMDVLENSGAGKGIRPEFHGEFVPVPIFGRDNRQGTGPVKPWLVANLSKGLSGPWADS